MKLSRRFFIASCSATLPLLALGQIACAATVVKVSLWDKGETSMEMKKGSKQMGMAMPDSNMDMATMGIKVDTAQVASGKVTFSVVNESNAFYHSLVISPILDPTVPLPYDIEKMMVDEAAAGRTAIVKELKPHDSGSATVDLSAGTYVLYCNIAGHYMMGMWTMFTVGG